MSAPRIANAPLSYGAFEYTVGTSFPVPDASRVLAAVTEAGYDDLRVIEAAHFLGAVRDAEQRAPGLNEMVATGHVLDAIERSAESGAWEPARVRAAR